MDDLETSTLRHYLGVLWRRRLFVVVPLVALAAFVYVSSHRQPAVYESSAEVLLNHQDQVATSLVGVQTPVADPGRYAVTQTIVADSPALARRVLEAAGQPGRSVKDLLDHTSIYSNADVLVFAVKDHDPATSAKLAAAYAREYTVFRRGLDTRELAHTLAQLESRIAALGPGGGASKQLYASLLAKAQDVRLLEALRQSNVYVIRTPARDDVDRIAPRPLRSTAIAAAVGLVLGLVAAFLVDALDTRVRSAEELEESLGLPLLGLVPRSSARSGAGPLAVLSDPATAETEAFLSIRTTLALANLELKGRTLLVASAGEHEGSSTVAASLAVVLARAGGRIVLVDLDLRDPTVNGLLGLADGDGFTTVALGEATLDDALVPIPLETGTDTPSTGAGTLHVLGPGPQPSRPGEFAASAVAAAVLEELRSRADLVLVVAPPLLAVGDAVALGPSVDALVLVSRLGVLRRTRIRELRRVLETWPAATLGFVLTGADAGRPRRGSGRRLRGILSTRAGEPLQGGRVTRRPSRSETAAEAAP